MMNSVCNPLISNAAELGFANDEDFREFKAVLDSYEQVVKENRGRVGLFKALAKNAMAKLVTDALSANQAAAFLRTRKADLIEARPEFSNLTDDEFMASVLYSGRRLNFFHWMTGLGKDGPILSNRVKKAADFLQDVNPIKMQEGIRQELSRKIELVKAKWQGSSYLTQGRLESPLKYGDEEISDVNQAFMMAIYDSWKEVEPLLAPQGKADTVKQYARISEKELFRKLEDVVNRYEGITDSDKIFLVDSLDAYFDQLNKGNIGYQARGAYIEWNSNYVMPNYHNKPSLLFEGFKGEDVTKIKSFDEYREKARDTFVNNIMEHLSDEKTFASRNKSYKHLSAKEKIDYKRTRLESIFDTMVDGLMVNQINDELAQVDNAAIRLSSINRKFAQKVLYFKDGYNHHQYLLKTNPALSRAASEPGHGFVVFDLIAQDGNVLSKDLTMLSLFGTNPALTLRRFSPAKEQGKSSVERRFVTDVFSSDDSYSLRSYLFPDANNQVLDIDSETFELIEKFVKQSDLQPNEQGADFINAFRGSVDLTRSNTKLLDPYLGAINDLGVESLKGVLFLGNAIMDPFTVAMRMAEAKGISVASSNAISVGADFISSVFSQFTGNLRGAKDFEALKGKLARATGLRPEELTNENLGHVAQKLGSVTSFIRSWDKLVTLNRNKSRSNVIKQFYGRARESKAFIYLGGMDMPEVTMITDFLTRYQVSDVFQSNFRKAEKTPFFKQEMLAHGLSDGDLELLADIHPDLFKGEVMDLTALEAPARDVSFEELGVTEEAFDHAFRDYYLNEMRKHNQQLYAKIQGLSLVEQEKAKRNLVANHKDFVESFKKSNPEVIKEWKKEYTSQYVAYKSRSFRGMFEGLADSFQTRVNDNGYIARVMQQGSAQDKLTYGLLFHLKSFMINSIQIENKAFNLAREKGFKDPQFTRYIANRLLVYGAMGATYQTVLGMINNERSGIFEIWDDLTDEEFDPAQKFAKSAASLVKMEMTGFPVGMYLNTIAYSMGRSVDLAKLGIDIFLAPPAANLVKDVKNVSATGLRELKRAEQGGETYQQYESRIKGYIKRSEDIVRKMPVGNAILPRLLMNYGVSPYMERLNHITTEAVEREEARAKQAAEGTLPTIFVEDIWNRKTDVKDLVRY